MHETVELPEAPGMVVGERLQDRLVEFSDITRSTLPVKPVESVTRVMIEVAEFPAID